MGQVYLAEQVSLKRKVALKIMRAELAANATSLRRFKAEAEAVARATHANIVQVYAIGEAQGLHYMALEYVDGRTLRQYVEKKGPPDLPVVLSIIRQVTSALQRAAELSIIHRDIKPENILLTRKGEVKVADFGLSRCFAEGHQSLHLTQTGVSMGTPLYMSPEQVENRPVDPRTDIYSFGATCYFMLTGQPPFRGENPFEVAVQHVTTQPKPLTEVRPDLPLGLCALVHKMMAKLPAERYQSGKDIIRDVAQLRDGLGGLATGPVSPSMFSTPVAVPATALPPPRESAPPKSTRWPTWLAAGGIVLALGAGALFGWLRRSTPPDRPPLRGEKPADNLDPPLSPRKEREQLLANELKRHGKTGEAPNQIRAGLTYAMELGVIYLEDWRLDEAKKFFGQFDEEDHPPAYQVLGRLGKAIVLAFQDKPAESNQLFQEFVNRPPAFPRPFLLRSNRHFRRMIARAVNHNQDNDPTHFPQQLEFLRWPPGHQASFPEN
jgi:serine/threonine-protein kinase